MEIIKKHLMKFCIICIGLLLVGTFFVERLFLPLSMGMILFSCVPFFVKYERKNMKAEEVVLIAVLSAIAAVSRVPFASIPSVQPTSFVVIMVGLVFGSEVGFMVGSTSAIVSNIFLGQGPWTPWQLLCWGMMGLTAGLLKKTKCAQSTICRCIFGFVWGFIFGWIMNLWYIVGFFETVSFDVVYGSMVASFPFDLAHAVSNVAFLLLFSKTWLKILNRVKKKYGILEIK